MTAKQHRAKRIAFVGPMKTWGGIELVVTSLCQEFIDRGHTVELILLRDSHRPYPDRLPAAVTVTLLRSRSKLDGIPALIRHLRLSRPDALITVKVHGALTALIARRLSRLKIPILVKVTNTLSRTTHSRIKRWLIRWIYPLAEGLIAVSQGVADDLVTQFGISRQSITVIYNPVLGRDFERRMRAPVNHPWLPVTNVPVILAVGRLTRQKHFDLLIRAFATLRQPCRLLLLGEGPERKHLESLIQELGCADRIALPGQVDDPIPYMKTASVFALSSRYEGFGNVLAEALATGTPVVATDCPSGPREILDSGRYGILVPTDNVAALAAGLRQALQDGGKSSVPVAAADRFQAAGVAAQYLEVINSGCRGDQP